MRSTRYYQASAIEAIERSHREGKRALLVMATGTGKTHTFSTLATRVEGQVLVLVHRDELAQQAKAALEEATGEFVGVEKAEQRHRGERILVASVQSLNPRRLQRIKDEWGIPELVIADEVHRYGKKARTFYRAATYFTEAKFCGVTATPRRMDRSSLPVDELSYQFDIGSAIDQGWLVPLTGVMVHLDAIDLSVVDASNGDLNVRQLDDAISKAVEGIVSETLRLYPGRSGPVFLPGKHSAQLACDRFNALKPGSAVVVTDDTNKDDRRDIMAAVKAGKVQYLCNCQVATEGFDWPEASIVVLGRPTKSSVLLTQMVGRGTRPLSRLFGCFDDLECSALRRHLIAQSGKPDCVVLDFHGNCGKHDIVSLVDVFADLEESDEVLKRAKKLQIAGEQDSRAALKQAKEETTAEAARVVASKVVSRIEVFDFFGSTGISREASAAFTAKFGFTPASAKQLYALKKQGVPVDPTISKGDATRALNMLRMRMQKGLATVAQCIALGKLGWTNRNIYHRTAASLLDYAAEKNWKVSREDLERYQRSKRAA